MRVLGIDPGLRITGYACLESIGAHIAGQVRIIEAGCFRIGKSTAATDELPRSAATLSSRLQELDRDFRELLERTRPSVVAIESIFAHYKHPATAIIMGHARGVLLLAVRQSNLKLLEFKPNLVKKGMTGHGLAKKDQMQRAVQSYFNLPEPPNPPDVADALAIALCAVRRADLGSNTDLLDVIRQA